MPRIVKVQLGDQEVNAIEQDFDTVREEWNEYRFRDGGKVRIKVVALKILRQVDSDGKVMYNERGEPLMVVHHKVEVVASGGT